MTSLPQRIGLAFSFPSDHLQIIHISVRPFAGFSLVSRCLPKLSRRPSWCLACSTALHCRSIAANRAKTKLFHVCSGPKFTAVQLATAYIIITITTITIIITVVVVVVVPGFVPRNFSLACAKLSASVLRRM